MNTHHSRAVVFVAFLAIAVCAVDVATACPTCKDGMAGDQATMVQGYFWSILFMMSMPFLILSGLGGYFYYLVVKARAQQAAGEGYAAQTIGRSLVADGVPVKV